MKCHCGLECEERGEFNESIITHHYYYCPIHGFQGWVNTEGFEYLD